MQSFHQFPEYANGPPTCWIFFLDVNAISRGTGRKRRGSGPCFPDISHNVEKRLRIRTLFHVRAFKLIMDGRIPLSSLFSTPRRFRREKRVREDERDLGREHAGQGIYTTRVDGWRVLGIRMDGEGCLHKYGNFVNQVSWRSVVEFFREIEDNVISQFSTASFSFSARTRCCHEGAAPAIWRAINRQFIR